MNTCTFNLQATGDLEGITCVRWNPDGHCLASAGRDMRIVLHDAKKGVVKHELVGHTAPVIGCSWCRDGTKVGQLA